MRFSDSSLKGTNRVQLVHCMFAPAGPIYAPRRPSFCALANRAAQFAFSLFGQLDDQGV